MTENTNDEMPPTSAQKAAWVEYQIRQATLGNLDSIACPFCGSNVVLGVERLCCKPMFDVAAILLDRMETVEFEPKDAEEHSSAVAAAATIQPNRICTIQ